MIRSIQIALVLALLVALAAPAKAQFRYEPPDLGPKYAQPETTTPPPRAGIFEYLDVAALFVALVAASYLALKKRSRAGLLVLTMLSLLYFGFYRKGCVCSIGAIQNVARGLFDREAIIRPDRSSMAGSGVTAEALQEAFQREYERFVGAELYAKGEDLHIRLRLTGENRRLLKEIGAAVVDGKTPDGSKLDVRLGELWRVEAAFTVPWVVIAFFTLPVVFALFFGRTFCAAVCPLGAIQEVVLLRPLRLPAWLDHGLGLGGYVYLAAAVLLAATGSAFIICRYDPFVSFFRLSGSVNLLILGVCLLAIAVFIGRPYCRFLCPYGAVLRSLSRTSKWHVAITPDECVKCRLCEDACPYGAIEQPTAPARAGRRAKGKGLLAALILLLPVLVVLGGYLGKRSSRPLSRVHATVRLAERVRFEERVAQLAKWLGAISKSPDARTKADGPVFLTERTGAKHVAVARDPSSDEILWKRVLLEAEQGGDDQRPPTITGAALEGRAYFLIQERAVLAGEDRLTVVCLDGRRGDELWREEAGRTIDASDAFHRSGRPTEELYEHADSLRAGFAWGAAGFGAFVGFVIGCKLLQLSIRRRRADYEPNRATCMSCGRCFKYCPRDRLRRKKMKEPVPEE